MKASFIYIAIGIGIVVYASWLTWFAATGVQYIEHKTKDAAEVASGIYWLNQGRLDLVVTPYKGDSNTLFSGEYIYGFILVDKSVPFDAIEKRDFVCYKSTRGMSICHSAREQTSTGSWIVSGDGNYGADSELVTPDNYLGVMYKKTVWKY